MKSKDKQKLKTKSIKDLNKQAETLEQEIFDEKMKRFTGAATNVRKYKMLRKQLATIKTYITLNRAQEAVDPKTTNNKTK